MLFAEFTLAIGQILRWAAYYYISWIVALIWTSAFVWKFNCF